MARTYGAIYLDIWRDKDFRALSHTEQYMYWALIFQFKLNGAGLLDYMPDRWAEATSDMTTADVEMTIKSLIAKRYVVHDPSTHELLVRTYVRNSKVWKMPKAFAAVIPAAAQIQSSKLRHVLLADLDKIPLGELSEAPAANGGPSVRAKIDGYLVKLRAVLDDGEPDDPAGIDEPDSEPADGYPADAERVSVPNAFGTDTDSANSGTSTRACAHAVPLQVHVPVQEPNPLAPLASVTVLPVVAEPEPEAATPQGQDGTLFAVPPTMPVSKPKGSKKPKKQRTPEEQERFEKADALTREWYEALPIKPMGEEQKVFLAVRPIVEGLLKAGHEPEAIAEAARRCSRAITTKAMEYQLVALDREAARGSAVQVHQGGKLIAFPGQRVSATDRAMAEVRSAVAEAKAEIYGRSS